MSIVPSSLWSLASLLGGQAAIAVLIFAGFRTLGWWTYRRSGDEATAVYRYRWFPTGYTVVAVLGTGLLVLVLAEHLDPLWIALSPVGRVVSPSFVFVAVLGVTLASFLVSMVAGYLAVYPYLRRVRDLPMTTRAATVRYLKAWSWRFGLLWVGASIFFEGPRGSKALVLGCAWVGYYAASPWLLRRFNATVSTEKFPEHVERIDDLREEVDASVRGPLVLAGRETKQGYAAVVGLLPGHRYLVVTDYLLESLTAEEFEAVLAHELGHVRQRHVPHLVASTVVPPVAWLAALEAGVGGSLALGLLLAIPYLVIRGWIAHRAEYAADAFAAERVGESAMIGALQALADLNAIKGRTGRVYDYLVLHPSMEKRATRLRTR